MWQPLAAPAASRPQPAKHDAQAWRAVASALRSVAPDLTALAHAELQAPSWRRGQSVEEAAFAEGRKDLWRELLRIIEEART